MKKFNKLCTEALFITSLKPDSDSAGPVSPTACPCTKDNFGKAIDDFMGSNQDTFSQPTDGIGETGEIEGDSETETTTSDVELECTEDGLRVKFNGVEIVLPKDVIQKIQDHLEHEATETPEEETEEHEESESESEDEDAEVESEDESEEDSKATDNMY